MKISTTISRAFALLAVVGLMLAPLTPPAMAMPSQTQGSMSEQSAADAHMNMAMPADMPCCPDKAPDCGKDCPLVALCAISALQAAPPEPALFVAMTVVSIVFPGFDAALSGLAQPPPARPPKT